MKRIGVLIAVLLVCAAITAYAQDTTMIRVDSVGGLLAPDTIKAGDTIKFYIGYVNRHPTVSYNLSNAFLIYSANAANGARGSGTATWTSTTVARPFGYTLISTGPQADTLGYLKKINFQALYKMNCFGCDGAGVDTISFGAAASDIDQTAMLFADSGTAFRFLVVTKVADAGQYICIDSSTNFKPTNVWKWSPFNSPAGSANQIPGWSGAKCIYLTTPSGVNDITGDALPTKYELRQNYPNPFNPSTKIQFDLPKPSHVKVTVFNVLGQAVATLVDESMTPGKKEVTWDGNSQTGVKVSSGMYFYKIVADDFVSTKKMLLLK